MKCCANSQALFYNFILYWIMGFPGGSVVKNPLATAGDARDPGLGRCPEEGNGNLLQCSCLEKVHGQRSLVGNSPWGRKESDTTEPACVCTCTHTHTHTDTLYIGL